MIQIRCILVPTDFTPCSQRAVSYAAELARRFDAEVVLVHAIEAPLNLPPHTLVHIDAQGLSMPIMDYVREAADRRMGAALEELPALLKMQRVTVVDVRDPAVFARAHIPGAVNVPLDQLDAKLPQLAARRKPVVVYDRAGGDDAKAVFDALAQQGLPAVMLKGGMVGWESEGFDVARDN